MYYITPAKYISKNLLRSKYHRDIQKESMSGKTSWKEPADTEVVEKFYHPKNSERRIVGWYYKSEIFLK